MTIELLLFVSMVVLAIASGMSSVFLFVLCCDDIVGFLNKYISKLR